jgi:hypothetical protein
MLQDERARPVQRLELPRGEPLLEHAPREWYITSLLQGRRSRAPTVLERLDLAEGIGNERRPSFMVAPAHINTPEAIVGLDVAGHRIALGESLPVGLELLEKIDPIVAGYTIGNGPDSRLERLFENLERCLIVDEEPFGREIADPSISLDVRDRSKDVGQDHEDLRKDKRETCAEPNAQGDPTTIEFNVPLNSRLDPARLAPSELPRPEDTRGGEPSARDEHAEEMVSLVRTAHGSITQSCQMK